MSLADIRPALRTFLLEDANVQQLVGNRVYPVRLPQSNAKQTSIVYHRISETVDHTMSGASGLTEQRIQVDAWAKDQDTANETADAVKERIDGFRGAMGAVDVQAVFLDNGRDDYDPAADLYRVSRDYLFYFGER